jgi:hypothetical protein
MCIKKSMLATVLRKERKLLSYVGKHNVFGHTNFWKKQQKNLHFFKSKCILGCLIKRKTKGFKNIFIGSLVNSIKNERF